MSLRLINRPESTADRRARRLERLRATRLSGSESATGNGAPGAGTELPADPGAEFAARLRAALADQR